MGIKQKDAGEQSITEQMMSQVDYSIEALIDQGLAETGLSYLFPYQRLVIANILEAARTAGIPFIGRNAVEQTHLVDLEEGGHEIQIDGASADETLVAGTPADTDQETWSGYGRQIVILPTGAGKSLCFQLPARILAWPTLVIFPILALMADQERRLRSQGTPVVLLRGNQTEAERAEIARILQRPANTFIIANPEVLKIAPVRRMLKDAQIAHIVIDEAHCVSQWGESFRPAYLELGEILADLKAPLLTAFTATASPQILEKIRHYIFHDGEAHLVMGNPDRPNISYRIIRTLAKEAALRHLLRVLQRPAIVFCSSRSRTEQLARSLRHTLGSRDIYFYHAGLEREEKRAVEDWFFSSSIGVLVATCAYGMGVDKSNIRTVIHFDCPDLVEAYLQEAGRAGRDGKPSTAVLLWGPEDAMRTGPMAEYGNNMEQCRREQLLAQLTGIGPGEIKGSQVSVGPECTAVQDEASHTAEYGSGPATCTGDEHSCDICSGTAQKTWREAQALVRLIHRNPRFFTLNEAADWVSKQEHLDLSREEARRAFLALLQKGTLRYSKNPLWKGTLAVCRTCPTGS
ncbi:RecQ family ATP-dependent DNA helicase [Gracilinema caldarium]|uniref:DNA 3'-5' helicase n=1 Tax=Gracilinema caldarium (strain ATCC 51460 / DSM 7334 / H1) TaxID=744872 RepID=F8EXR9_GRAC1|nr:RecQ family ATP-dependent DNA helicase [Gracilinema caldarium]AEJ20083.1 ATP-dependent DNA helicase, RecQ family [Gracilinema caldarium DSM 7334]